jgi:hypothetical protein
MTMFGLRCSAADKPMGISKVSTIAERDIGGGIILVHLVSGRSPDIVANSSSTIRWAGSIRPIPEWPQR